MRFEIHRQKDGPQFYWKLVAANNETLATSELYHNKDDIVELMSRILDDIRSGSFAVVDKTAE